MREPHPFERNWEAIDAVASEILDPADVRPVHMMVTVTDYPNEDNLFLAGLAYGGDDKSRTGGTIVLSPNSMSGAALVGTQAAHELGHTLGLAHDDVEMFGHQGFMFSTCCGQGPFADWDADSLIQRDPLTYYTQAEVWTLLAVSDAWPRPPGFGYVGCTTNPDSCKAGHPTLSCVEGMCVQN